MKILKLLLLLVVAQVSAQTYQITYTQFFEGKESPDQDKQVVFTNASETFILSEKILAGTNAIPYEVQEVNRKDNSYQRFGVLKGNRLVSMVDEGALTRNQYELKGETKKVLGYQCKKAVTFINSNTIEVWYTNDLNLKGGPSVLGQNLGLVLEVVRNGSNVIRATEIKKQKNFSIEKYLNTASAVSMSKLDYQDEVWKNKFTTLPIFKEEIIRFGKDEKDLNTDVKKLSNGTVILKKIKFPEISNNDNVFVQLIEQSNGDAYDRTGSVFVIPEGQERFFFEDLSKGQEVSVYENGYGKIYKGAIRNSTFQPPLELMRFYTPFGIGQYNDKITLKDKVWRDKVTYRQDITDLKSELSGKEVWVGAYVGNYDKGGHKVDLEVTIHNDGISVYENNVALPLFSTVNMNLIKGDAFETMFNNPKGLEVSFTLDKDLDNAYLRYISTGHGGWERGDEFVPKTNTVSLDGKEVFKFIPWRSDCASYRLYNPASGNFDNGLSSSDYSRSNWCPATVTNPQFIPLGNLKAGTHEIQIQIPLGENEGSSFSAWNVSGVLIGKE